MENDELSVRHLVASVIAPGDLDRLAGIRYDIREELAAVALLARKTDPWVAERMLAHIKRAAKESDTAETLAGSLIRELMPEAERGSAGRLTSRAAGRKKRGAVQDKHAGWQRRAKEIWENQPSLSAKAVAERIAREEDERSQDTHAVRTIRRLIKKPPATCEKHGQKALFGQHDLQYFDKTIDRQPSRKEPRMQKDVVHLSVIVPRSLKIKMFTILASQDIKFSRWLIEKLEEHVAAQDPERKEVAHAGA
jgi:hypothetical protein